MKSQAQVEEIAGVLVEAMPNDMFRVKLDSGALLLCHLPSETRRAVVRLLVGERVVVARSPIDASRGRILRRGASSGARS